MKITVNGSAIIHPAQKAPIQRLWLSNLDLIHSTYHVPTLYLYSSNGSSNFFEAKVLKEALRKVLVPFYPAAGRLARDGNGRIEINCNGEGVLFIEAETDLTATELGEFLPGDELRKLIPTLDSSSDITSCPFILLQVTKFLCGGVSVGVGWHHILGDGSATLHFMNAWSALARGASITIPPFIDRTILRGRMPPKSTVNHNEFTASFTMKTPTNGPRSESVANFKITLDQLDILKAKANNNESKTKYSAYEILTAHIWRSACEAYGFSNDQATRVGIAIDARSRLRPPLSPGYFGNAIIPAKSIALSGELFFEPFWKTVERIHKTIKQMDDEYLRSVLDYIEEVGDLTSIKLKHLGRPNFVIISWMQLPFYDVDFGWGAPVLSRPGNVREGTGYINSSPTNDEYCILSICLETKQMQSFQKLFFDCLSDEKLRSHM